MTTDAGRRLLSIDVLDETEHDRLAEWGNRTVLTQPASAPASITELFARQVELAPDATALVGSRQSWTYRELDDLSRRLADYLLSAGLRSGDIVPLCFEKSLWTTVAVLAVLKIGAAFTVLEPNHPKLRIAGILRQTDSIVKI